ncbi:hypothetical protein [Amycolatopsis nalaikhensis]|uniref:Uncharacterized protein n=1 Tax=Amycolatopsis nalaikhensis TaxID=715472 RepID=A0ABY8XV41_9PSEU|nr:hypothetical protein [Amycolatopsis sp. 2-2]WIV59557.1 hypothetical protein QP939_13550 [Amycolatopsis sp. 2-2]
MTFYTAWTQAGRPPQTGGRQRPISPDFPGGPLHAITAESLAAYGRGEPVHTLCGFRVLRTQGLEWPPSLGGDRCRTCTTKIDDFSRNHALD